MNKYIYIVFIIFFFIFSCNNNRINYSLGDLQDVPITIDIKKKTNVNLDTILNTANYIPLETSEKCLIGNIDKILIKCNNIYIADFQNAKALFVFDMYGRFLFKIDERGKGPGEYISFDDFDVLNDGMIYIWDASLLKFLLFDSNGILEQETKMKYRFHSFCIINSDFYLAELWNKGRLTTNLMKYDGNTQNYHTIIDDRGIHDHLDLIKYKFHHFYYSPSNIYYYPRFSTIIYSIDNNGVHPAIGIENLLIPSDDIIKKWVHDSQLMYQDRQYLKDIVDIFETDNYISFRIVPITYMYNKKNQKCYLVRSITQTTGVAYIKGSTEEYFFGVLYPDRENISHIIKRKEILSNITEESNPVVVLFNFTL